MKTEIFLKKPQLKKLQNAVWKDVLFAENTSRNTFDGVLMKIQEQILKEKNCCYEKIRLVSR